MARAFYKDANAAIVVFDVANKKTLTAAATWKKEIDAKLEEEIPTLLLANKCDLPPQNREVTKEEIDQFCKQHNFRGWYETSAKSDIGIADAMKFLTNCLQESALISSTAVPNIDDIVDLNNEKKQKKSSGCCG